MRAATPRAGEARLGRAPAYLLLPAALAVAFLVVPLVTLVLRAPVRGLPERLTDPVVLDALWLSLWTATAAMAVSLVVGLPLAWALARLEFPGRSLVRVAVTVPLVLPPVVAGVALLTAFGRTGFIGAPLRELGITIPYTSTAVVVAHTFVALPFLVVSVEGALRATSREYDEVAAVLGASRGRIFRRVTVPMALPGITAGLVLGWARSLGEFGATITFAGNFPGVTQTMPLAVYEALNTDPEAALVLSLVMLLVSVAVLALLRERWFGQVVP
ncbi:MAG TPA: molybdate ABC transporter permease subunit [Nocardioidaceae bacterium]|nr:molybdate ABC transporter permease subunit [Nocardioidaceae bacterium]